MASHPKKPKQPGKPVKSRHTVALAKRELKHDARGEPILLEHDVQIVLAWLSAAPLRTITGEGMHQFVAQQDPPWTPGYWNAVKVRVTDSLVQSTAASADQTRGRLLKIVDELIPHCRNLVLWKSCKPTDPAVKDPRTSEFLTWRRLVAKQETWKEYQEQKQACLALAIKEPSPPFAVAWSEQDNIALMKADEACPLLTIIDHGAAQGYLKFIAEITLPKKGTINLNMNVNKNDLAHMSDEELDAAHARLVKQCGQDE